MEDFKGTYISIEDAKLYFQKLKDTDAYDKYKWAHICDVENMIMVRELNTNTNYEWKSVKTNLINDLDI